MSLTNFIAIRRLATSTIRAAILSSQYKSSELWNGRLQCQVIRDNDFIKVINNKIMSGSPLSNLELDIFINVASPSEQDKEQLREAAKLISDFRKTLMAHRLLPSTPHALCRLFLESSSLSSLVTLLNNRIRYGIFPDSFSINLLLDTALESKHYALASKVTSLVMLQEEFGINRITDKLSLLALVQYTDTKTDFQDWPKCDHSEDPVLAERSEEDTVGQAEDGSKEKEAAKDDDDDEDEDDAEYIRVPFLRNPYFDNHFDITNPRIICGKSLSALARSLESSNTKLSLQAKLLGSILHGSWDEASVAAKKCSELKINMGRSKETLLYYLDNLHELEAPSDEKKQQVSKNVNDLSDEGPCFVELAKKECENLNELEARDIEELKSNLGEWSRMREVTRQAEINKIRRDQLRAEIEAKKEELKRKEDYLYFYDRLKKSKLSRIEYN